MRVWRRMWNWLRQDGRRNGTVYFLPIPKALFTESHFQVLTCEAKVLYGMGTGTADAGQTQPHTAGNPYGAGISRKKAAVPERPLHCARTMPEMKADDSRSREESGVYEENWWDMKNKKNSMTMNF